MDAELGIRRQIGREYEIIRPRTGAVLYADTSWERAEAVRTALRRWAAYGAPDVLVYLAEAEAERTAVAPALNPKLHIPRTCDAFNVKRQGICAQVLDENGACWSASDHRE